jgi:glutamyl-tRNA reductase
MNFQLIGVNHKTAPVEVRERLAVTDRQLPDALQQLLRVPGVGEGMILSTCNRVEVLIQTTNGSTDLRKFLAQYFGLEPASYESHLYEYRQHDAVRHVFRVAASLDSMIVGEPQILGQVKEAYATARAAGAVQSYLDLLLTRAFAVAKKIRTETAVGPHQFRLRRSRSNWPGKFSDRSWASKFAWSEPEKCLSWQPAT